MTRISINRVKATNIYHLHDSIHFTSSLEDYSHSEQERYGRCFNASHSSYFDCLKHCLLRRIDRPLIQVAYTTFAFLSGSIFLSSSTSCACFTCSS